MSATCVAALQTAHATVSTLLSRKGKARIRKGKEEVGVRNGGAEVNEGEPTSAGLPLQGFDPIRHAMMCRVSVSPGVLQELRDGVGFRLNY